MLAAIRILNRLELVTETLRAALNDLAEAAPAWRRSIAPAEWYGRYGRRIEESGLPKGEAARQSWAGAVGQDGLALLAALSRPEAPEGLGDLPILQTLRQVWERHFQTTPEGKPAWRAGPELSRAAGATESPYDVEARHSTTVALAQPKRDTVWTGYKAHVSETCEDETVRLSHRRCL